MKKISGIDVESIQEFCGEVLGEKVFTRRAWGIEDVDIDIQGQSFRIKNRGAYEVPSFTEGYVYFDLYVYVVSAVRGKEVVKVPTAIWLDEDYVYANVVSEREEAWYDEEILDYFAENFLEVAKDIIKDVSLLGVKQPIKYMKRNDKRTA